MISILRSAPLRRVAAFCLFLSVCIASFAGLTRPGVANDVEELKGSWSGRGRITFNDGKSENIHCTAYYSGGRNELRMAIQCKSEKSPIHIRSRLRISGTRATGEWEERTYNASGSAKGRISGDHISLNVTGGGFEGTMSVSFGARKHNVSITTKGISMRGAKLSFSRR